MKWEYLEFILLVTVVLTIGACFGYIEGIYAR